MLFLHFVSRSFIFILPVIAYDKDISDIKKDAKRQVSLNDIIQGALNIVRPIIETSEPLQSDLILSRKLRTDLIGGRDAEILGVPKRSTLDDTPICKSNPKICKFIICSARNFQNDGSISSLNLAAQMLSDSKLRKTIASDPSILLTICQEHGLSPLQCKLLTNTFQLIDQFISTIEPLEADSKKLHRYKIEDDPYYDDSDAPPVPIQPGMHQNVGSQTWSINANKNINGTEFVPQKMQLKEKPNLPDVPSVLPHPMRNLLNSANFPNLNTITATSMPVNSLLTLSSSSTPATLPTFPQLIFTFPTFATIAPMLPPVSPPTNLKLGMSPTVNLLTKEMQMLMSPFDNKPLLPNTIALPLPLAIHPDQVKSFMNPVGLIRNKRTSDYYDNIEDESDETRKFTGLINDDPINDNNQKVRIGRKGIADCMRFLKDD